MGNKKNGNTSKNATVVTKKSDRERVIARVFDGPAHLVFKAWTTPELMKRWWVPKSLPMKMIDCVMDVRTGGSYKMTFVWESNPSMDFFGKYIEVVPNAKLVWTNDESGENGSTTTATFTEKNGKTTVLISELYPSKEAMEADGAHEAAPEMHAQLDELLADL